MENGRDIQEIGGQLGCEGVEQVVGHVERFCQFEEQRIELVNKPGIVALRAKLTLLAEQERGLREHLRQAPPPGDVRARKRKARYSWAVAVALTIAGFFFSLMAFDPYRLGWKSYLYCLGIAIVTPYCVEKFLNIWGKEGLVKALASIAFVAAILSLTFLAVIRGDVLMQQVKEGAPAIVFEEDHPAESQPRSTFYDETLLLLRLVMTLLAVAMELAAGLALHDAHRWSAESGVDPAQVSAELACVREEMISGLAELTALESEAAAFAARFWRDFYRAMLTHTARNALRKLLVVALAGLVLVPHQASAEERMNLVVLVDLSQSVAVPGNDGETECQKNLRAVGRLLAEVPAGSHVTVFGITDNSFAQPYVMLSAETSPDAGYFNERLSSARQQLVMAWQKRSEQVEPRFSHTDILGALLLASQVFRQLPEGRRNTLFIFSDMRQDTKDLNLDSALAWKRDAVLAEARRGGASADLENVDVYVLGVVSASSDFQRWSGLKTFWLNYFDIAGAHLKSYSALRELPRICEAATDH